MTVQRSRLQVLPWCYTWTLIP